MSEHSTVCQKSIKLPLFTLRGDSKKMYASRGYCGFLPGMVYTPRLELSIQTILSDKNLTLTSLGA
jgi:hypothetical protein